MTPRKHKPPSRLAHVFEFYGETPRNTPERAALLNEVISEDERKAAERESKPKEKP